MYSNPTIITKMNGEFIAMETTITACLQYQCVGNYYIYSHRLVRTQNLEVLVVSSRSSQLNTSAQHPLSIEYFVLSHVSFPLTFAIILFLFYLHKGFNYQDY